ncbi:hypothetical protein V1506DRAFT_545374 [Lipomyces tetrasporus]
MARIISGATNAVSLVSEHDSQRFTRQFQQCLADVPARGSSGESDETEKEYDVEKLQSTKTHGFCSTSLAAAIQCCTLGVYIFSMLLQCGLLIKDLSTSDVANWVSGKR